MTTTPDAPPPGRQPVYASNAVVATGHPAATSAALEILLDGGNAVDAALAASAALCVVMPHMTGAGGDGFVQVVNPDGAVRAYNAGGMAGSGALPDRYPDGAPTDGLIASCIPGLPDCWALIHKEQATMPLSRLFERAIDLARNGFPVSLDLSRAITDARHRLAKFPASARIFLPGGSPPQPGDLLVQSDLADTLRAVAESGRDGYYDGPVAAAIADAFAADAGGLVTVDDLHNHCAEAGDPLRSPYRDYTITEQPPISQGHVLLQELLMLDHVDMRSMGHLTADSIHTMIEVKKLAFADRTMAAGDPRFVEVDWENLLSPQRAAQRVAEVDPQHALVHAGAGSKPTDTTQFVVGDADGRAVTFIQSVYHPFGSAAVAQGTGMILNNRMFGFSTDPALPNVMAPGKRTVHTLNTYAVFKDGDFMLAGGTPGADFQVQTNLQILTGVLDYDLDLQAAVDAPRWGHLDGLDVIVEDRLPADVRRDLRRRGHMLRVQNSWDGALGCSMLLARGENGWIAMPDQRREFSAVGF